MNTQMTKNGVSTCNALGKENYQTFSPAHKRNKTFFQYDYRHTNGKLFSTVAPTLEKCREKRDNWINNN